MKEQAGCSLLLFMYISIKHVVALAGRFTFLFGIHSTIFHFEKFSSICQWRNHICALLHRSNFTLFTTFSTFSKVLLLPLFALLLSRAVPLLSFSLFLFFGFTRSATLRLNTEHLYTNI